MINLDKASKDKDGPALNLASIPFSGHGTRWQQHLGNKKCIAKQPGRVPIAVTQSAKDGLPRGVTRGPPRSLPRCPQRG